MNFCAQHEKLKREKLHTNQNVFFPITMYFLTENRIFFSSYEQSFFSTWHEKIIIRILFF